MTGEESSGQIGAGVLSFTNLLDLNLCDTVENTQVNQGLTCFFQFNFLKKGSVTGASLEHCIAKDNPEFCVLLPLPPRC